MLVIHLVSKLTGIRTDYTNFVFYVLGYSSVL